MLTIILRFGLREDNLQPQLRTTTTNQVYTLDALSSSIIYTVKVRAVKSTIGGDYSSELTTPIIKPINLNTKLGYHYINQTPIVTLAWDTRSTLATHTDIYRRRVGDVNFSNIKRIEVSLSTWNDSTVTTQSDYEYRIRSVKTTAPTSTSGFSNISRIVIP